MSAETFNQIASAVQSLVLAIAVLVGGGWALYTFIRLRQVDRARAELEQARRDLLQRAIIDVSVKASQMASEPNSPKYLLVEVSLVNKGSRTEVLDWYESGCQASMVLGHGDNGLDFGQPVAGKYVAKGLAVLSTTVLPGGNRVLTFLLPVPDGGIYHVEFWGALSHDEAELSSAEHAAETGDQLLWSTSTLVSVA
jgi:hypothetical protein